MRLLILFFVLVFTKACSNLEPAEDQWDLEEKEDKVNLFTKDENGKRLLDDFIASDPGSSSGQGYRTNNNINMPAIDEQSFEDFELFKAWRRAQQPNSENYQEYQEWRAYQQYLRYKAEQERAPQSQPSQ